MSTTRSLPALMTPKEVATYLHTTEQRLAQDRHLGRGLPYARHGRSVLYRASDIADYLESTTVTPPSTGTAS